MEITVTRCNNSCPFFGQGRENEDGSFDNPFCKAKEKIDKDFNIVYKTIKGKEHPKWCPLLKENVLVLIASVRDTGRASCSLTNNIDWEYSRC